ncbi:MAG TPA: Crp/Fnr family transcriptional regulator [Candidatus Cybelea sp.]|jgi:CRP-like cAMP-binding protein
MPNGRRWTGNLFLDNLPAQAFESLRDSLTPISLSSYQPVDDEGLPLERVLFPIHSVISIVLDMADGSTAEVGIVGREGMTGLAIVLGQTTGRQRSIVQIPDGADCLPIEDFRAALDREPQLRAFSLRYAQAVLGASARLSACNALHPINERCARWLLMAHDRVGGDRIRLTQEFLGQMLGVRRASVAAAASALQSAGFITYTRGQITVVDRAGLEATACECYESTEREWEQTMGYTLRTSSKERGEAFTPQC